MCMRSESFGHNFIYFWSVGGDRVQKCIGCLYHDLSFFCVMFTLSYARVCIVYSFSDWVVWYGCSYIL